MFTKSNYITNIYIHHSRNIKNLNIDLSTEERKHLIITGNNGSGKTSLLNDLHKFLIQVDNRSYRGYHNLKARLLDVKNQFNIETLPPDQKTYDQMVSKLPPDIQSFLSKYRIYGGTEIQFSNQEAITELVHNGDFIIGFYPANRLPELKTPQGISKVKLRNRYHITDKARSNFLQHIVNLKADRSFAKDEDEFDEVKKIDLWFDNFIKLLRNLFQNKNLELKFNRKEYNFFIIEKNKIPYSFTGLADGYSAILTIVSELMMRMEGHGVKAYDLEGIVLIDEIETHLHVDQQKKVLPFLSSVFPNIQFIVSTHSPFVLSSLSNTIICDLESRIVTTDLSSYSYDALIESYFKSDKYSDIIKMKLNEYESLISKAKISDKERLKQIELEEYFNSAPKYLSKELLLKLEQLELLKLDK